MYLDCMCVYIGVFIGVLIGVHIYLGAQELLEYEDTEVCIWTVCVCI